MNSSFKSFVPASVVGLLWPLRLGVRRMRWHTTYKSGMRPYQSDLPVIYFDITMYASNNRHTGIQRVVEQFLQYLPDMVQEQYELVCVSGQNGYYIVDPVTFAVDEVHYPNPGQGDIFLSIDLNANAQLEGRAQLRQWKDAGCHLMACVYDLVYILHPEYVGSPGTVCCLQKWLQMVALEFDTAVCISQAVCDEFVRWMSEQGMDANRISTHAFHLGADFAEDTHDSEYQQHTGRTFIMVSTVEPRKGYVDAVRAFELARQLRDDMRLVIVGRRGWKYRDIEAAITTSPCYNESLFWYDDCDDRQLAELYEQADVYISTAYYEGFGLGVIEAAHRGLPVIVRDIPVYHEVTEGHAVFFSSVEELADAMCREDYPEASLIPYETWQESVESVWNIIQTSK